MMDTDGMASKVYQAAASTCIQLSDLAKLRSGAGLAEDENLPLELGFDPAGQLGAYRSRLSYTPLLPEELAETPRPPSEMRFGDASWSGGRAIQVKWHADYRKYLEGMLSEGSDYDESFEAAWSPHEAAVIQRWEDANGRCRGGSGDDPATLAACEERDGQASAELESANICYGREGEYGYQHQMHRCEAGSLRPGSD